MINLNENQQKVIDNEFPILVIAGRGSGKTRVVIEKVSQLVENVEDLKSMLILTFTNKARREIIERLEGNFNTEIERKDYFTGTFHSIFYKFLKMYETELIQLFGFKKRIKIIEPDDDFKIFRNMIKNLVNDPEIKTQKRLDEYIFERHEYTIKDFYNKMIKNLQQKAEPIKDVVKKVMEYSSSSDVVEREIIENSFQYYYQFKINEGLLSFNDILYFTYVLLKSNDTARRDLQNRFKYIIIDEYQDTNPIQDDIVELLVKNRNLCVVGDPDQSIYAFLGANIENIIRIKDKFNMKLIQLTENYRSNPNIVDFSNDIKSLFETQLEGLIPCSSSNKDVENKKIVIKDYCNQEKEVINHIRESISEGIPLREIAVISRNNAHSYKMEGILKENRIPYKKLGGKGIYEVKYVKDLYSLLKVLSGSYSLSDIENSFSNFKGIGKKAIENVVKIYTDKNNTFNVKEIIETNYSKNKKLMELKSLLFDIDLLDFSNFNRIISNPNYTSLDNAVKKADTVKKKQEIEKNISYIKEEIMNVLMKNDKQVLDDYLSNITLDNSKDKDIKDCITLTTAHSSKGLEWQNCYVLNAQNGEFPSNRSLGFAKEVEEEKRLFYVACSRAKEFLMVTSRQQINEFVEPFLHRTYIDYQKTEIKNNFWF